MRLPGRARIAAHPRPTTIRTARCARCCAFDLKQGVNQVQFTEKRAPEPDPLFCGTRGKSKLRASKQFSDDPVSQEASLSMSKARRIDFLVTEPTNRTNRAVKNRSSNYVAHASRHATHVSVMPRLNPRWPIKVEVRSRSSKSRGNSVSVCPGNRFFRRYRRTRF